MYNRVTITSILQFASIIQQYPRILDIAPFQIFNQLIKKPNGETCKRCDIKNKAADFKLQLDISMSQLSDTDKDQLKKVLNAKEIWYYRSNNRKEPIKI